MRRSSLLLLVLVGCDREPTSPAKSEPKAAPASDEKFPPTGTYETTVRVVSDTCAPAYVPPAPWRSFVHSAAEKDIAKVNVGLTAVPPSSATSTLARSDFRIQPREPTRNTFTPPDCAGYTAERTFEITEATKDGFKLTITVTHGDGGTCAPTFPANCTTTIEQAYRLVESMCRAECYRGAHLEDPKVADPASQKWIVDCRCE